VERKNINLKIKGKIKKNTLTATKHIITE